MWAWNRQTRSPPPPIQPATSLPPRTPIDRFIEHASDATGAFHKLVVQERPHVSALALSEACLAFSAATDNADMWNVIGRVVVADGRAGGGDIDPTADTVPPA
jgi:hypothetical protein